ncbi:ParA family protein, partial [Rhizobium johnstonii]|uniref:ParA family protein n=1 Tax=Rhizobium johnstonii TaxID=3019933 RepID=UPI003F9B420C
FPQQVLDTIIPRSVRVSEAPSYGQSVIGYDPGSSGSLSYLEVRRDASPPSGGAPLAFGTHRTTTSSCPRRAIGEKFHVKHPNSRA